MHVDSDQRDKINCSTSVLEIKFFLCNNETSRFHTSNDRLSTNSWIEDRAYDKGTSKFCCTIETDKGPLKSCLMRASGKENASLISNAMMKPKHGMLVPFCGGKIELMSKRKSIQICLRRVRLERVSSTQSRKRTREGNLTKLRGGKDGL